MNAVSAYLAFREQNALFPDDDLELDNAIANALVQLENEPEPQQQPVIIEEWMEIVHQDIPDIDLDNLLENAPQQNAYDWVAASAEQRHHIPHARTFLAECKNNAPANNIPTAPDVDPNRLNEQQQQVYQHVLNHFREDNNGQPLLTMVHGTAGTGKSYVINCLRNVLNQTCTVLAPTGIAALNISGSTLHSFFQFCNVNRVIDLRGPALQRLQDKCADLKYVIIDELSMVGCRLINVVDRRLRQAFPHRGNVVFGGMSIIMFGDLGQLAPVADSRMFAPIIASETSLHGHAAYRQFATLYILTESVRQADDEAFLNILLRLRNGNNTEGDYAALSQRFDGLVEDREPFADAIHLYPTCAAVQTHNTLKLQHLGHPIAAIESAHNNARARTADANTACGLSRYCTLSIGAKIMLRANLWVEQGLVNGSIGVVTHILFDQDGPPALPAAVICTFPGYTGPSFLDNHPHSFPITPIQRTWSSGATYFSRTGLPLSLAWALTIHKSQGLTLDRAFIDIGRCEKSAGLSFVAMSRVRKINDLMLAPFPMDRLTCLSRNINIRQRKEEEQRLANL
jgi:ATP-dependent DNA helicase PIF1